MPTFRLQKVLKSTSFRILLIVYIIYKYNLKANHQFKPKPVQGFRRAPSSRITHIIFRMAPPLFIVSAAWRQAYPGACAGVLAMRDLANPRDHPALTARRALVEQELRERYASLDRPVLAALPILRAYGAYYRRFKKTYHVQLQLESITQGKPIPSISALVTAMFMAELKNQLLTAGHDLDAVQAPVTLDVATGHEMYILLNGQEETAKSGDMLMRDGLGVISTVIYGPDRRTRLQAETRRALFTVYAPLGVGVEAVARHLEDLRDNVHLFSPSAAVELMEVYD